MTRQCCTNECNQGRSCPLRTVRIPTVTHRSILRRIYRSMCRSWIPAIAIYAVVFAAVAAANYQG